MNYVKMTGKTIPSMDFPQIRDEPINEYITKHFVAGVFPWLFPGGVGDLSLKDCTNDCINTDCIHIWLERLMRYKDCRFERDKMFCFYANDFCQRKLANSNAGFFVNCVCGKLPPTVDDLIDEIDRGDYSFITKLQYFSGNLKGTDSFWRRNKLELDAWMAYHVEQSNGPPTLFITLSCAEYWWPDLHRLLVERLMKSVDRNHHKLAEKVKCGDHSSCIKAINLHTGLVQEFFIIRTK